MQSIPQCLNLRKKQYHNPQTLFISNFPINLPRKLEPTSLNLVFEFDILLDQPLRLFI